ncbi:hypothetical protein G9464_02865 [Halostella sp. JP-L12]|uniref:hypothetical protein n=1 Tax=Halostella TaxID=1843185 RepID=UPI0013CECD1E|nr:MULTISPECIES: hypothetical protein [Halostella]NHN46539.1 hypothetical protein [Halostella sp. JP-L12]
MRDTVERLNYSDLRDSTEEKLNYSNLKAYGIIAGVSYLVTVLIFKDFLFSSGVVNSGDLVWPYFRSQSHEYTTTLHQLPNHIPHFAFLWSLPGSPALLQRILFLTVYTLIGTIGGIVVYWFVKNEVDQTTALRLGVMGGLLYLLNPINVFQASQIFLLMGYAVFPLVIYTIYSAYESSQQDPLKYGILLGMAVTATSGDPRWPVWSFLSIGVLFGVLSLVGDRSNEQLLHSLKVIGVAGVSFLALSAFWLVPLFHPDGWTAVNPLTKQNPPTRHLIDMLNGDSTWVNALRFHADWWPPLREGFTPNTMPWRRLWFASGLVLPIVALGSLFHHRKRALPVAVLYVILIFVATAPTSSLEVVREMYDFFVFNAPFGTAFRTAFKWLLPASFPLVLLASMAVGGLVSSSRRYSKVIGFALIGLLVVSAATNSWLLFTTDMRDGVRSGFTTRPLPEDEHQTYRDIQNNLGEHAVFAIPREPQYGLPMRTVGRDSFRDSLAIATDGNDTTTRNAILRQISVRYLIDYGGQRQREVTRIRNARRTAYIPDVVISGDLADSFPIQRSVGLENTSIVTGQRASTVEYQIVSSVRDGAFDGGDVIHPSEYTYNADPNSGWARTTLSSRYVVNNLNTDQLARLQSGQSMVVTTANGSMDIPFRVDENGSYKLLARYFEGREGGAVRVLVDGQSVTLDTEDRLNRFVENEVGTFELEEGRHTLTLENVNGENAIPAFSVLSEERYEEVHRTRERTLANKTLIHLLEANSDLYIDSPRNEQGSNATNGTLVEMRNGSRAYTTIETQVDGSYRPAIRGAGNFTVRVDNRTYRVESDDLRLTHLESVDLSVGQHNISVISHGRSSLDTVWLYMSQENETLSETLSHEETNAQVESFERGSSTKYRVQVNASEPYTLSFAEDYGPLWIAEVRSSNGTERYGPVPLFSAVNGFHINETGEHTVIIRYRPQRWFYQGIIISAIALVTCIGYLVYNRREDQR